MPTTQMRLFIGLLFLWLCSAAAASPYSALYVFGDSLSDNGNLAGHPESPPPPYVGSRLSNGPVAAEYLAADLGVTSKFADYAVGGATTGLNNPDVPSLPNSGVMSQVLTYAGAHAAADPNALYMIWAGANDLLNINDPAMAPKAVATAVTNITNEVGILAGLGARHFLVPNMVDLGLVPRVTRAGSAAQAAATALSIAFNAALGAALPMSVTEFDTFGAMHQVLQAPQAFGLGNVTAPCFNGNTVCGNPAAYFFWDDIHPTTAVHRILAAEFAEAVPEPGSLALAALGLVLAGVVGGSPRRNRRLPPSRAQA